jgi:glycosyltransferase involved in cell wall biosynthesis
MSRIVHFLPLDTVGGVETIFTEYLKHPHSNQHIHNVMILNEHCHHFFKKILIEKASRIAHCKYRGFIKIPRFLRPTLTTRIIKGFKPDIRIIYNTLENPCAWSEVLSHEKTIFYERGGAWGTPTSLKKVYNNIAKVERFFCNSYASRKMLECLYGINPDMCDVIYNPFRFDNEKKTTNDTKKFDDTFTIGMAGRLIPHKGIVIGLHALAALLKRSPKFMLIIAGDGPEMSELKKTANRLGIENSVTFLGAVENMPFFFSKVDLFLCPSLREPFGNVVVEANGYGCPVVCSNVDGLPEAITPGKTGHCIQPTLSLKEYLKLGVKGNNLPELVYNPEKNDLSTPLALDPKIVADDIWDLSNSPETLDSMSLAGKSTVNERFSFDEYVNQFHLLISRF